MYLLEKNQKYYQIEEYFKLKELERAGYKLICTGYMNILVDTIDGNKIYDKIQEEFSIKEANIKLKIDGSDDAFSPDFFKGNLIGHELIKKLPGNISKFHTGGSGIIDSGMEINLNKSYSINEILKIFKETINEIKFKSLEEENLKLEDVIENKIPIKWLNINNVSTRFSGILLYINEDVYLYDFKKDIYKIK